MFQIHKGVLETPESCAVWEKTPTKPAHTLLCLRLVGQRELVETKVEQCCCRVRPTGLELLSYQAVTPELCLSPISPQ